MKRKDAKPSRRAMEEDLSLAVHRARGLLVLIVAALENNGGTGLSALAPDECTDVALLVQNVEFALGDTQDALTADDRARRKAER